MSLCGILRSAAVLLVHAAQAIPFGIFDPRSIAMGGTGSRPPPAATLTTDFRTPLRRCRRGPQQGGWARRHAPMSREDAPDTTDFGIGRGMLADGPGCIKARYGIKIRTPDVGALFFVGRGK